MSGFDFRRTLGEEAYNQFFFGGQTRLRQHYCTPPRDAIVRTRRLEKIFGRSGRDYAHTSCLTQFGRYLGSTEHKRSYEHSDPLLSFNLESATTRNFELRHDLQVFPPYLWVDGQYTPGCLKRSLGLDSFVIFYEDGKFVSVLDDRAAVTGLEGLRQLVYDVVYRQAPELRVAEE
jgi:hypothetical protein